VCAGRRHTALSGGAGPQPPLLLFKHHVGRDKGHRSDGNISGQAESLVQGGSYGETATRDGGSDLRASGRAEPPHFPERGSGPRGKCTAGDCGDTGLQNTRADPPRRKFARAVPAPSLSDARSYTGSGRESPEG
jgi:hypothetical protein